MLYPSNVRTVGGLAGGGTEPIWERMARERRMAEAGKRREEEPIFNPRERAYLTAMEETQRRAEEDRRRALEGFGGVEELFRLGLESPEAISPEIAGQMYEKGRVGIEAGTQALQRQLQESYARRGIPGGAMMGSITGVAESGIGQMSGLQRDIGIERALRKRQDLLNLMSQGLSLAEAKARIYGQTIGAVVPPGTSLSNLEDLYGGGIGAGGGGNEMIPPPIPGERIQKEITPRRW